MGEEIAEFRWRIGGNRKKKKSLYVNYKDSFTDKAYWILILAAIIFVILLFCSLHIAAVSVLVAAPVLYKGFKSGAGYVFDQLIKHCNYTISKLHVDKTSVVEEIKHSASYYETKALLAGRDPEVGRSVALNLEPLEYWIFQCTFLKLFLRNLLFTYVTIFLCKVLLLPMPFSTLLLWYYKGHECKEIKNL